MTVRVGTLVSELRSRSRSLTVPMGDVELFSQGDRAGTLRIGDEYLPWGDRTAQLWTQHVKGPGYKYLTRQPLDWQRQVVKHHADERADNPTIWYVEGDQVVGVYDMDAKIIPLVSVAEQIADVFSPDDEADILWAPDQVEINVTSQVNTVTVPGLPGIAERPLEGEVEGPGGIRIGDASAGGVRIVLQPGRPERAPYVEEFWYRYWCTNGAVRRVAGSLINLRGRTVLEILQEMNNVMRTIWEGLEQSGQRILHSAETPVPGLVPDFIRQVGRERNINAATILRLQERALTLRPDPSVYDITQIFTALANEEGIPVTTRRALQAIGGDLTVDTERMVHRCTQCERPLEA